MGELFKLKEINKKNNGKAIVTILVIVVIFMLIVIGASSEENDTNVAENSGVVNEENVYLEEKNEGENYDIVNTETNNEQVESNVNNEEVNIEKDNVAENKEDNKTENKIDLNKLKYEALAKIPYFSSLPYYVVNNNKPFFYDTDLVSTSYEEYSELDALRKMRSNNSMHWKRFNANGRTWKYRKYKTNRLANCKI